MEKNPHIHETAQIGTNFQHEYNVVIYEDVKIGNKVSIGNNVIIYPGTIIHDNVVLLDNTVIGRPPRLGPNSTTVLPKTPPLEIHGGVIVGTATVLYSGITLHENVYVADMVNMREWCVVGENSTIGKVVSMEHSVKIGKWTRIQTNSQITEYTEIGDYVFFGPDVSMSVDPSFARKKDDSRKITICDKAMIGNNATIAPGVTIGENALVAAGSMVMTNVPPRKVVFGNPAKVAWDVDPAMIL